MVEHAMQPQIAKVAKTSNRGSSPGERRGGRKPGTPNKATGEVRELAQAYGPTAIEAAAKLAGLVGDGAGKAESEQARIAAIGIILDRAYGKAAQPLGGDPENPLFPNEIVIRLAHPSN